MTNKKPYKLDHFIGLRFYLQNIDKVKFKGDNDSIFFHKMTLQFSAVLYSIYNELHSDLRFFHQFEYHEIQ